MAWVFNPFTGKLDNSPGGAGSAYYAASFDAKNQNVTGNGALSIDYSLGRCVTLTLTGNVTSFAVTNWPLTGFEAALVLNIENTGAYGILAWPAGAVAGGGVAPTIASGAGKKSCVMLRTKDAGGTVFVEPIASDYQAL